MSSTRKAKDDSVLHQARYASSVEFERGIIANLVAKRCALLNDPADRELIWFVQYLSHQPGGLGALASTLLANFADRIGTATMAKIRKSVYLAEDVKKIRLEIPTPLRRRFLLRGETKDDIRRVCGQSAAVPLPYELRKLMAEQAGRSLNCGPDSEAALEQQETARNPASYPSSALLDLCREAAVNGFDDASDTDNLERELARICLDPNWDLALCAPWYFADLVNVLRDYQQQWIDEKSRVVTTSLGQKVSDNLDYTRHSRGLTLMEGNTRLGKSFAAKSWCERHPGQARFIEVPDGNDDAGFFRALAQGLGLGNFLNYKACEIKQRVESVLLTGDLILVLDEAQRLWPQRNLRYGFPGRIVWVMRMVNAKVPVCLISTEQFTPTQKAIEKSGWNSAQLTGRIGHYEFLPVELSDGDLMAVARAVLPNATEAVLKALAAYARTSSRYLAAVDSIAKRAHYLASRDGRRTCSTDDVRAAMRESVLPSDERLKQALATPAKAIRLRHSGGPIDSASPPPPIRQAPRSIPEMTAAPRATSLELVED